ncbi:MAG: serine--tRNA ligase [Dehalococcoidia bacterium]|nr:serine--tRNA ligase [Dehalococcoidia bacterium]
MLELKYIRENADEVRTAIAGRKDSAPLDDILALDAERRDKLALLEEKRRARKEIARTAQNEASDAGRLLRDAIKSLEERLRDIDSKLGELLLQVPNIPQPSVPHGTSEEDNIIARSWGEPKRLSFPAKPHWELGESLDIIDFERGVKLSGTRFYVLKGLGAKLQRAIIALMLDLHTNVAGYTEVYLPYLVRREVMVASGNLPKFADNLYREDVGDMWFVPTAEVPLTGLHAGEILPPGSLPLRYAAYTACFRREKMSAGKDTRGIKRGHQFDKVELYKIVEPEHSNDELEAMVADVERVLQQLELPYRLKALCTADLGFASSKTYDLEVWAPGCNEWLEVSSCSNCLDFQARRAAIRYRPAEGAKTEYVHTLNGSGLALPRIMIAILENYQLHDGTIFVPTALQPFMGMSVIS